MANPSQSASVLLLNLPQKAFCGIDLLSFTTSPRFHGIKNLPPGLHLVFTGATNSFSLRYGVWFRVPEETNLPSLHIKKWDAQSEELIAETDVAAVLRWRANLGGIWRDGLTPYRQSVVEGETAEDDEGRNGEARVVTNGHEVITEETGDWIRLTDCITEHVLDRIAGKSEDRDHWALTSASSAKIDVDDIPGISKAEASRFFEKDLGFLPIDLKQTWREGAVGRERTLAAQDRSWALRQLVDTVCHDPMDIIGELQFCFLSLLTLNNNSCLEQWKRLLGLMLTCQEAIQTYPGVFTRFLATLKLQLEHNQDAEGGLFDMRDEGSTLLKPLLKRFRQGLEQQSGSAKVDVMDELDELEDYLKAEHGWLLNEDYARHGMLQLEDGEEVMMDMNPEDDEDESGDYAPTMVELTREQAEQLGLQYIEPDEHATVQVKQNVRATQAQQPESSEDEDYEEEMQDLEEMDARY